MNVGVPADTVLLRLLVSPGQFVEASQPLFEVADLSQVWVRVSMSEGEFRRVDRVQNAHIVLLESSDADEGMEAEAVEGVDRDQVEDGDESGDVDRALYYGVDNGGRNLALGQRVRVRLPLSGSGTQRIVIPYAAVIYGTNGETWVYTNPEPLVFVRRPILIDYIEGDQAFLLVGPASGSEVVTVGAEELYGSESEFAEE